MGAHEVVCVMVHFPQQPILGLQILREVGSFNERSILPVELAFQPLLPRLSRVDYWVHQFLLLLLQEVGHFFRGLVEHQPLQQHFVVHVSVRVLLAELGIGFGVLDALPLLTAQPSINCRSDLIKTSKDRVFNQSQSNFGDMCDVSSTFDEELNCFEMVPLNCDGEGSLPLGSDDVGVSLPGE